MTEIEKWRFLFDAPGGDARHPKLKRLAELLLQASEHRPARFVALALTVARDWVRFVSDAARVDGEDIAGLTRAPTPNDAVDALDRGADDCDAKARLFVALCRAVGLPAQMVPYWYVGEKRVPEFVEGATLRHVAARVMLGDKWRAIETTLARAIVGEPGEHVPKEANGRWLQSPGVEKT